MTAPAAPWRAIGCQRELRLFALVLAALAAHGSAASQAGSPAPAGAAAPGSNAAADHFARAAEFLAAGQFAAAVGEFLALAESAPNSVVADDALFSAAQLTEEKLADPAAALRLYERLLSQYPHSRTALAAARRAARLRAEMGAHSSSAAALAQFSEILKSHSQQGDDVSISRVENLIREHRNWPGLPRALVWLGSVHGAARRWAAARHWFEEAIAAAQRLPPSELTGEYLFSAYRGAGDAALEEGLLAEAERYFLALPAGADPGRMRSQEEALARLAKARGRRALYRMAWVAALGSFALLAALLRAAAGSWPSALRALWPPPSEATYMVPIAVVLAGASLTGHTAIAPAVTLICAGGVVAVWLSGAGLNARAAPRRIWLLVHLAAAIAQITSIGYIAVQRTRLVDLLVATLRFGPDR